MKSLIKISLPLALTLTVFYTGIIKAAPAKSEVNRQPAIEKAAGFTLKKDIYKFLVSNSRL